VASSQITLIPGIEGSMSKWMTEKLAFPIVAAVVAGVLLSQTPKISADTVDAFLNSYFTKVTQENQRFVIYQQDLTPSFRNSIRWRNYNKFWKGQERVSVKRSWPVSGNPFEFTVTLNFYPLHSKVDVQTNVIYLFACKGFLGETTARIPWLSGCPLNDIQIDRGK
jgi:hypothetical protein